MFFGALFTLLFAAGCSVEAPSSNKPKPLDVRAIKTSDCHFYSKDSMESYIRLADLACVKKGLDSGVDPNGLGRSIFDSPGTPYLKTVVDSAFHAKHGEGSAAAVMALFLHYGANVNVMYKNESLLELAMRIDNEYQDMALYMIRFVPQREGQDAIFADQVSKGGTPLEIAINLRNENFVEALLKAGAKVEAHTRAETPLIQSIQAGLIKASLALIAAKADVNVTDRSHDTALILSMLKDQRAVFEKILPQVIEIDQTNARSQTALIISAQLKEKHYFDLLVRRKQDFSRADTDGKTAIFYLVQDSDLERTKKLVERGASLQTLDNGRSTLLHHARSVAMVQYLVGTKQFDIDQLNLMRKSPLAVAVDAQNAPVVEALARAGGRLSFRYPNQDSLLHAAVRGNDLRTAQFLLAEGLEVDAKNDAHETPAFGLASIEMAELLAAHEADFSVSNIRGQNLLANVFRPGGSLPAKELLAFLMTQGVAPATYLDNGETPVHVLVSAVGFANQVRFELLDILVTSGATLDVVTQTPQRTPALLNVRGIEWVKYFASKNANLSLADARGRTLLQKTLAEVANLREQLELHKNAPAQKTEPIRRQLSEALEIQRFLESKNAH